MCGMNSVRIYFHNASHKPKHVFTQKNVNLVNCIKFFVCSWRIGVVVLILSQHGGGVDEDR